MYCYHFSVTGYQTNSDHPHVVREYVLQPPALVNLIGCSKNIWGSPESIRSRVEEIPIKDANKVIVDIETGEAHYGYVLVDG